MTLRLAHVVEKSGESRLALVREPIAPAEVIEAPGAPAFARDVAFLRKAGAAGEQRLVYGIVLEPETSDSQGDIYNAEAIEAAAHGFMADYQNVGMMHRALVNDGAEVVESYISPCDFEMGGQTVKTGTWVLVVHISSDALWEQVQSGELTGFSIGGYAERTELPV